MPRQGNRNVRQRTDEAGTSRAPGPNAFPVLNEEEQEFFDTLHSREVYKPTSMKWSVWEQRRDNNELFAVRFLPLLETLNLVPFAKVDEPVSQTLVQEFHTSMRFTGPTSFKYRTNGIEHHVTNDDFIELFGFPIKQEFTVDKHTSYDRKEFWRSIKSDADWNEHEYPATMIYSNATYMAYRFFATVVLNKDVPSRLSGEEVYLLWCMINDPTAIEIFPHINARIRDAQSTSAQVRPMPLGLGTFVTILAKKYGMGSYANDTFLRPHSLGFGTRKLRRRGGDVTVDIQSEDGTVVSQGRLALTPTPPPPTQQNRAEPESTFHTGEGSNTQAGGHTLEDIWENLEATRTLVQGYRSEVIGYQADLEWYRGEVRGYNAAVEANTLATRGYQAAVEANTLAFENYRADVNRRGDAHDEMLRAMMAHFNLGGPPPPPHPPM